MHIYKGNGARLQENGLIGIYSQALTWNLKPRDSWWFRTAGHTRD